VIWSVFFQGNQFSQKSISKTMMQQEANLVITNLTKIHQTSKQYVISSSNCEIEVIITKKDGSIQTQVFTNTQFCITTDSSGTVDPDLNDLKFTVTVSDRKELSNHVVVNTLLYRIKSGGI
jgi:hypothetical protein